MITDCWVVQDRRGKFFYFDHGTHTCTQYWTDNLLKATRIEPFNDDIRDPTYYFESSDRMKEWLHGSKLVKVKYEENITLLEEEGPMWQLEYDHPLDEISTMIYKGLADSLDKAMEGMYMNKPGVEK